MSRLRHCGFPLGLKVGIMGQSGLQDQDCLDCSIFREEQK